MPLILGTLALFMLAVLPLAMSLAPVERAQLDRSKMMRHALLASDLERRRIAQDLHDGVIQDLAGLGVLPTAQRSSTRAATSPSPGPRWIAPRACCSRTWCACGRC